MAVLAIPTISPKVQCHQTSAPRGLWYARGAAALEAKIDEIAARQAAQVDELGNVPRGWVLKLTASLAHLDGQLGRLDARTGDGGQPGAGAGASTGPPHKELGGSAVEAPRPRVS